MTHAGTQPRDRGWRRCDTVIQLSTSTTRASTPPNESTPPSSHHALGASVGGVLRRAGSFVVERFTPPAGHLARLRRHGCRPVDAPTSGLRGWFAGIAVVRRGGAAERRAIVWSRPTDPCCQWDKTAARRGDRCFGRRNRRAATADARFPESSQASVTNAIVRTSAIAGAAFARRSVDGKRLELERPRRRSLTR